jgi:hypothetical protein
MVAQQTTARRHNALSKAATAIVARTTGAMVAESSPRAAESSSGARPSASRANPHPKDEREGRMPAPQAPLAGDTLLDGVTDAMGRLS